MPAASRPGARRELPDETLMGRYADGDAEAFDELFRRYERRAGQNEKPRLAVTTGYSSSPLLARSSASEK
jgi:hypothetical protein